MPGALAVVAAVVLLAPAVAHAAANPYSAFWPNSEHIDDGGFDETGLSVSQPGAVHGHLATSFGDAFSFAVTTTAADGTNQAMVYTNMDDTVAADTWTLPACDTIYSFPHADRVFTYHYPTKHCTCAYSDNRRCPFEVEIELDGTVSRVPYTEFRDSVNWPLGNVPTGVVVQGAAAIGVTATGSLNGCAPLVSNHANAWCVVVRGECSFGEKQANCATRGAIGMMVVDVSDTTSFEQAMTVTDTSPIPTIMVRRSVGESILATIQGGLAATIRVGPSIGPDAPTAGVHPASGLSMTNADGTTRVIAADFGGGLRAGVVSDVPDAGFEYFRDAATNNALVISMPETISSPSQIRRLGIVDPELDVVDATLMRAFRPASEPDSLYMLLTFAGWAGFVINDVTVGSQPQHLGEADVPVTPSFDALSATANEIADLQTDPTGSYAYIVTFGGRLYTFDISNVEAPVFVGSINLPTLIAPTGFSVVDGLHATRQGDVIAFGLGSEGWVWVDVSLPAEPRVMAYKDIALADANSQINFLPSASPDRSSDTNSKWWISRVANPAAGDESLWAEQVVVQGIAETQKADNSPEVSYYEPPPRTGQIINLNFLGLAPVE